MPYQTVETGEFAGWLCWVDDPFESHAGPYYFREDEHGPVAAFRARPHQMNGAGFMHGGCLMTFADFALFALAQPDLAGDHAVTVSFASEFLAGAAQGEWIEARGEVLRNGRSLVFVRGLVTAEGRACLNFSGTIKRVAR